jgi:hypothetical protein
MFTFEANAAYKGAEQMIAEQSGSLNFGLNQSC